MLSFKVVCPQETVDRIVAEFSEDDAVLHIAVVDVRSAKPAGAVVLFDVVSEAGDRIVRSLRAMKVDRDGAIMMTRTAATFSHRVRDAELLIPGESTTAVVWEEVEARVRDESGLTPTFVALTTVATIIAAVGLMTDSLVLLVGAMVVGPEYGALMSIAIGIKKRSSWRIKRGLVTIGVAFTFAFVITAILTWIVEALGWLPNSFVRGDNPLTAFVTRPDHFTVVIAFAAAIAGTLSLTQVKAGTLIGVMVSVTTIPALAAMGVAAALGHWRDLAGSAAQLLVNIVIIVVAGSVTLMVQSAASDQIDRLQIGLAAKKRAEQRVGLRRDQ